AKATLRHNPPQAVEDRRACSASNQGPDAPTPFEKSGLAVDLPHNFRPPVDDRQHSVRLLGREHRDYAGDTHLCQALDPVEILAEAERGDFDGSGSAAGLPGHLAELRQNLGDITTGGWNPTIAIADCAPRAIREGAADMDRRVWFLYRFGLGDHRIEID